MEQRTAGRAGLALAVVSAATFGSSGSFATSLLDAGWSPGAAVTVRVLVAAAVLAAPASLQLRHRTGQLRAGWPTLVVYGVAGVAGAQLCYFMAIEHLSVAAALLLEYSGALLVVGWLWLRGGQRPRRLTVGGALVAVLGLVLVLDLLGDVDLSLVGVLWGLGAAVGLAAYFVVSAETGDVLPPLVVACGGLGVGGVVLLAAGATGLLSFEATQADVTLLDARVSWLVPVLGLSLVAAVVAYVTGIVAARMLGAKLASFAGLTEVLFAVGLAWLLLGQALSAVQLVGGALVIAGIALVRLDELRPAGTGASGAPVRDGGAADLRLGHPPTARLQDSS